jgi:predicted nuclease of restriction endonuclease-like (RecB) superfamily
MATRFLGLATLLLIASILVLEISAQTECGGDISAIETQCRSFYEKEAVNANWSVRELKRQIESSLFERLLLSNGDANKEKVLSLAMKGNEIAKPADIIRDPYVFEFLGLPEDKPLLESDLEKALVEQIEKFLLELGRGFMFVGTQQRVSLGNHHYFRS